MNILIVNSDDRAADTIAFELRQRGHQAHREKSGLVAFSLPVDNPFDAILIDDTLPYLQGAEVAQHLRRRNVRKPILLTARTDSVGHRRVAKISGVDDFLVKPVSAAEIEAHIDAILRPVAKSETTYRVRVGTLEIDRGARTVTNASRSVSLSRTQILLLWVLAHRADSVVSHEALCSKIWKYCAETNPSTLSTLVTSVRRRLKMAGVGASITTVRGAGYMLNSSG